MKLTATNQVNHSPISDTDFQGLKNTVYARGELMEILVFKVAVNGHCELEVTTARLQYFESGNWPAQ